MDNLFQKVGLRSGPQMHLLRFAKFWLTLGYALIALVVTLSLWPDPTLPDAYELSDKLGHVLGYMVLMLWFGNIYHQSSHRLLIGISLFAMGVCLEFLQGTSRYRTFAYADMFANGLGIALGLLLAKTALTTCLSYVDTRLFRFFSRR